MQNHFGIQNLWMVKNLSLKFNSCSIFSVSFTSKEYEVVGIVFCLCYEFCACK